jgi:hypothetical protein
MGACMALRVVGFLLRLQQKESKRGLVTHSYGMEGLGLTKILPPAPTQAAAQSARPGLPLQVHPISEIRLTPPRNGGLGRLHKNHRVVVVALTD